MKEIKHLFFDLDHTLWDYDKSSKETLLEIFNLLKTEGKFDFSRKKFLNTFYSVNNSLWHQYNLGEIDREYIKMNRFQMVFTRLNRPELPSGMVSEYFIKNCSLKPYLMPETLTALNYLAPKYKLHIITNGFLDSQTNKIISSGINKYFDIIVTSECANATKPSKEIFEFALKKAGAFKKNSLMIGDNNNTDINGGQNFGIGTIFYDPSGRKSSVADFSISSHFELIKLL